ncbi:ribonuclease H-like domain-containing protein [Tanacetum coccineum]
MACSLLHTDFEVEALVQKLIDEDKGRQNAILDLALQFEISCTTKDDLRKAYEKCNDISQESRALIDTFLKEGSDKDYELNLSMYGKAAKFEKQMDAKLAWLLEKYYYRSQESVAVLTLGSPVFHWADSLGPSPSSAKLRKQRDVQLGLDGAVMSTQEYMKKVIEDVGDIMNFFKNGKLDLVVAIVKSCSPNVIGNLTMTMKDLSCTIPGIIHHKFIGEGGYGNDINVGAALILANVLFFTSKPSMHYLKIKKRNVVKVFSKDTVPSSDSR